MLQQAKTAVSQSPNSRHKIMHMRMIAQITSPRMQYPQQPQLPADKTRVLRQLLARFRRGAKKQMVEETLVSKGQRP